MDRVQERRVDLAADDGRRAERRQRLARYLVQAPADDPLHAAREHPLGKARVADGIESARVFGEGAHDLHDEEGNAFGLALEQRHEVRTVRRRTDHSRRELDHLPRVQSSQQEHPRAGHRRRYLRALVVAEASDHEHRQVGRGLREPRQQAQALAAGPLKILEDDEHRCALHAQQLLDREEEPRLRGLGVERRRIDDLAPDERAQVGHQRLQDLRVGVVHVCREHEVAQDLTPRMVGTAALAHGLAAHHRDAVDERAAPDLLEEARLADAALAADQPRCRPSRASRRERVARQLGELVLASDERCALKEALTRRDRLVESGAAPRRAAPRSPRRAAEPLARGRFAEQRARAPARGVASTSSEGRGTRSVIESRRRASGRRRLEGMLGR